VASTGLEVDSVRQLQLAGVPAVEMGNRVFSTVLPTDAINATLIAHPRSPTAADFGASVFSAGSYPPSWFAQAAPLLGGPATLWRPQELPISVEAHEQGYLTPGSPSAVGAGQVVAGGRP
jgi:hypothetical protein